MNMYALVKDDGLIWGIKSWCLNQHSDTGYNIAKWIVDEGWHQQSECISYLWAENYLKNLESLKLYYSHKYGYNMKLIKYEIPEGTKWA